MNEVSCKYTYYQKSKIVLTCFFKMTVVPSDMVALKMRGLPWRVEVEEIEQFFSRYAYVRDSIHLGVL